MISDLQLLVFSMQTNLTFGNHCIFARFREALENLAKLPFDIVADNWRYEQFEGKIPPGKINDRWWELR